MTCTYCNTDNVTGFRFCRQCGQPAQAHTPHPDQPEYANTTAPGLKSMLVAMIWLHVFFLLQFFLPLLVTDNRMLRNMQLGVALFSAALLVILAVMAQNKPVRMLLFAGALLWIAAGIFGYRQQADDAVTTTPATDSTATIAAAPAPKPVLKTTALKQPAVPAPKDIATVPGGEARADAPATPYSIVSMGAYLYYNGDMSVNNPKPVAGKWSENLIDNTTMDMQDMPTSNVDDGYSHQLFVVVTVRGDFIEEERSGKYNVRLTAKQDGKQIFNQSQAIWISMNTHTYKAAFLVTGDFYWPVELHAETYLKTSTSGGLLSSLDKTIPFDVGGE